MTSESTNPARLDLSGRNGTLLDLSFIIETEDMGAREEEVGKADVPCMYIVISKVG